MNPKVILYDLETGLNLVTVFSLFQPGKMIPFSAIQSERYIISMAWKELGGDKVYSVSLDDYPGFDDDPTNDKLLVKDIINILKEADALVAHNGDKFDSKYIATRSIKHGYGPLPNQVNIDTLKIAKNHFNFNSNRLDYLGQYLGVGRKLSAPQQLWLDALSGKRKAVRSIELYNKGDVLLLEKVYKKLAPYAPAKLNRALYSDEVCCPLCGSEHYVKDGTRMSRTGIYQRYQCKSCKHYFQGTKTIKQVSLASK